MRIDCHNHCSEVRGRWPSAEDVVAGMGRLGIDKTCCSSPITKADAGPEEVREANDDILRCMKRFPDAILGQCFVNPGYARHAQDEITRCVVDGGMSGIKLYHQYRIDEPVQFPVIERCIELGVPVLMHAGHPTTPGSMPNQARLSSGEHFVRLARRYPEAMLVCAHIGGGGDWEWQLKALRGVPNVFLDTSGSVIDQGMVERCVRDLGIQRLLFGTDMNLARGVGKLLDARITERQRERVFGLNFSKLLQRRRV